MSGKSQSRRADRVIARLAAGQYGVVARWQLLAAGVSAHQIDWRLASGRLHQLHQGVYLVGHPIPPPLAREQAALLAYRNDAVLSDRTAAQLWNLLPYPAIAPVCVTIPPGRLSTRPGINARSALLHPRDIRSHDRLPLTSPPRTILDAAATVAQDELERLVAEAHYRRLAREAELVEQLTRNPGKRGAAALKRLLELPGGPQRTRSPAEREMLRLLRGAAITGFEMNARIHGYEVDVLWRAELFAIEIDGFDAHSGRTAFERDRLKRATLTARGVTVMPVTGRQIRRDPAAVVARVRHGLANSRAGGAAIGGTISHQSPFR